MKTLRCVRSIFVLLGACIYLTGCGDKFYDPTQVGRWRPVPAVNVILNSLGVAQEATSEWEGAEDPRPVDAIEFEIDYAFGPGDAVSISIFELLVEGVVSANQYVITESGKISIPEVGIVNAAGLTEAELEEEIKRILSPIILKDPVVTVSLLNSQRRAFSIMGDAVPNSGRFGIPRYDFRLTDALAIARVRTQFNVSYVYVSRSVTGTEPITEGVPEYVTEPDQAEELTVPAEEMLEIIAPSARKAFSAGTDGFIITSAEMVTDEELVETALPEGFETSSDNTETAENESRAPRTTGDTEWLFKDGRWFQVQADRSVARGAVTKGLKNAPAWAMPQSAEPETIAEPIDGQEAQRVEWIFQDGKWMPLAIGRVKKVKPAPKLWGKKKIGPLQKPVPEQLKWDEIEAGGLQTRVIKIPTDKLAGGDPRYNIVIRPGDRIHVPVDVIGEFFVLGNTNSQGAIPLTGRPLTLKMAIAAAGGLGPLAWPKRCEIIRRIGKDKEETVMVDLDKIASGEQPDFFIKPLDLINVGTHPTARWRAVLRNAFRATYGFGFLYDRNFADRDFGTSRPFGSVISNIEDFF